MKTLAFLIAWAVACRLALGAGAWNGVAFTAWNGASISSWNGTSVSAGGGFSWPTGLVSYIRFTEASGTRADALSAVSLSEVGGTINSGTGLVDATAADFESADSRYLRDNGGAVEWYNSSEWTVCFWVKAESLTDYAGIWSSGNSNTPTLLYRDSTRVRMDFLGVTHDETFSMTTGNWYFVCARFNDAANTMNISVNGAAWGTDTTITGAPNTSANILHIGQVAGQYWDGLIDEAFIFSQALDDTEVSGLYNSGAGRAYP